MILPLRIPLAQIASLLAAGVSRAEVLREWIRKNVGPDHVTMVLRALDEGCLLAYLDGLDEATEQLEEVKSWVQELLSNTAGAGRHRWSGRV